LKFEDVETSGGDEPAESPVSFLEEIPTGEAQFWFPFELFDHRVSSKFLISLVMTLS